MSLLKNALIASQLTRWEPMRFQDFLLMKVRREKRLSPKFCATSLLLQKKTSAPSCRIPQTLPILRCEQQENAWFLALLRARLQKMTLRLFQKNLLTEAFFPWRSPRPSVLLARKTIKTQNCSYVKRWTPLMAITPTRTQALLSGVYL